ncbi:MAG: ABC transporter permease [Acidimicrobiia bacterium]|nr:MAG: ABC transporter permease [Acidimicrobiia bacterium]
MLAFAASRLVRLIVVVIGATLITFTLLRLAGDPATVLLPVFATPEQRAQLSESLGLDRSLPEQYLSYVGHAAVGDFGESWKYRQPAGGLVLSRYAATLELVGYGLALSLALAVVLAIFGARREGRIGDGIVIGFSLGARAIPSFWLGTLLILVFSVKLGWLPTSGRGSPQQLIMPVVTIALFFVAEFTLVLRTSLLEAFKADYVRAARAKGLSERSVTLRHAARNSVGPLLAVVAVNFGALLGGTVIVENVFAWPGLGRLAVEAVGQTDYPVVQATVLLLALTIAVVSMVIEVAQGYIDPRVRRRASGASHG